jgi:type I restriction enzyme S subunit
MLLSPGPYPRHRDSRVPWIGDLPDHWKAPRLKTVFREVDQRSGTGVEPLLSLRMREGLIDHLEAGGKLIPAASLTHYKVTRPGELVMNRMRAATGLFGLPPKVGLVSPDYAVLRPRMSVNLKYFLYLFRSPGMKSIFRLESHGLGTGESGFLRLYTEQFGTIPAPLPPLEEQAAIARFLDHADRRIRRYIAAKEKLIALLNEQKQAIIHGAVTRGLDPNIRLKPSGVEWLGAVPEHWSVLRNKAVLFPRKRTVGMRSTDFTLLSLTLRGVIPRDLENPEGKFPADFGTYQAVEPGELVFCLFDMDETPRTVGIAPVRGMVTGAYSVFESIDRDTASFLYHFYLAMDAHKRLRPFYTGLRKVVQNDTFMGITVAIPPHEEMLTILATIAAQMARIDGAVERTEREVHLVHEFRTRLISDVVTGKLDVRQAAEQLSEGDESAGLRDHADAILDGDVSEDEADLNAAAGDVVA